MTIENPQPRVVVDERVDPNLQIDSQEIGQVMHLLGISDEHIANSSIQLDSKYRLNARGTTAPNLLNLLLHGRTEFNHGSGSVVRIGTRLRGKPRTPEEMNRTLVHELEHVAQIDRLDPRLLGQLAIFGFAALGGVCGYELTRYTDLLAQVITPPIGAVVGFQASYEVAPHEVQARARSRQIQMRAISRIQL